MDFECRDIDRFNRIAQSVRVVRQRPWVDHQSVHPPALSMEDIDQFPFVIALKSPKPKGELARRFAKLGIQLGERHRAVDFGLSLAQEIQVGAVQQQDVHDYTPGNCEISSVTTSRRSAGSSIGSTAAFPALRSTTNRIFCGAFFLSLPAAFNT